uniref:alpha-1,2-Mannosidase n=1 Tax=Sphaeramia orbicularis TaxID=375764 RepID=A0A672ZYF3_9TELE
MCTGLDSGSGSGFGWRWSQACVCVGGGGGSQWNLLNTSCCCCCSRHRIKSMFYHAYNSYLDNAFPYDELRPLTCDGQDTWGSFSLTLIDALDTYCKSFSEWRLCSRTLDFDIDVNASVFETNIRVIGGLLSAHLLAGRAGMDLEPGWPCSGPLLRMAEDAARKLLPAFQTPTGMRTETVNLLRGWEPSSLEFGALSRLTGDPVFEDAARQALRALWKTRSDIGLVGNHIDISSKKWVAQDAGIGAGVDSYFEYLVKGAVMLQDEELLNMFLEYDRAIQNYTRFDDWYLWVHMHKGTVSMPVFQSLEAFWPGLQSLLGNLDSATRTFQNYYSVWRQFGGLPEFYSIPQGYTVDKREGYPLRPELIESAMYLFRATGDHTYLQLGKDALESIEKITKTPCGYASVKDLRDHQLDNRMESFFLAETIKYLYLLFDPTHFLHGGAMEGEGSWEEGGEGGQCVLGAGGFIFNTEAHPLDPAALYCCSRHNQDRHELRHILLSLSQPGRPVAPPPAQTEGPPLGQSESVALKPGDKKSAPLLSCPVQPFSARLSVLGQVFTEST